MKAESGTQLFAGFATFSVGPLIGAAFSFALVPVITRLVEPNLLGQLSMYTTTVSLVSILALLGMDHSYARQYVQAPDKSSLLASTAAIPLAASITLSLTTVLFSNHVSRFLFGEHQIEATILVAISIPLTVLVRFVGLTVRMQERGLAYSLIQISQKGVNLVLTIVLVVMMGSSLVALTVAPTAALAAALLIGIAANWKSSAERNGSRILSAFRVHGISAHLAFGLPLAVAAGMHWLLNSMDKIALRTWSSFDELGLYAAAFRLSSILLLFHQTFAAFWIPRAFRWHEERAEISQFQAVIDGVSYVLLAGYGVVVGFRRLIILLLGAEYRGALDIVPVLSLAPLLFALSETTAVGITISKRTYWATIAIAIAAILNFSGNWLFVPRFGAMGAASATVISLFALLWLRNLLARRLWQPVKLGSHLLVTVLLLILAFVSVSADSVVIDAFAGTVAAAVGALMAWRVYVRRSHTAFGSSQETRH